MSEPAGQPDEPHQLSATDFLPLPDSLAGDVQASPPPTVEPPLVPIGPGLIESCIWTVGFLAVQVAMSIVVICIFTIYLALQSGRPPDVSEITALATTGPFLAAVQGLVIIAAYLAAAGRFQFSLNRALNLRPFSVTQGMLISALVLPVSLLCSAFYVVCDEIWQLIVKQIPLLAEWEQVSSLEQIRDFADQGSFPLLLFAIAVAPALAEEVVFRGVIGRGLTIRYGTWLGVVFCSVLFGVVHLYPPHVLAVIPLGFVLHFIYLQTRSFWAPVMLHFLNNAWATVALVYGESLPDSLADETASAPPELLLSAAAATAALLWMISQLQPAAPGNTQVAPLQFPQTTRLARCIGTATFLLFVALFIRLLLQ